MDGDFMAAMRRTLDLTKSGDLGTATRQIQAALSGSGDAPHAEAAAEPDPKPKRTAATASRVEDAEIVDETPPRRRARKPLGATLDALRRRPRATGGAMPELADGAVWDRRRHAGRFGARDVRVHIPASVAAEGAAGLIVMLHGCTQTPEDFAIGTAMGRQAEDHRLVVAYPAQDRSANAQGCWAWFQPADQGRGGESALIAEMAGQIATEFAVPDGRVFVAGLSAGGAMAAVTAAAHPEVFGAAGVHSGLAPGAARDMVSAFAAMRGDGTAAQPGPTMPMILFHGDADRTVAPAAADWGTRDLDTPATDAPANHGRRVRRTVGRTMAGGAVEVWRIAGAGHAWSGGDPRGSYADAAGPDASAEMVRFFLGLS
ncbi:PHB depolymerase family esterase [uncultured Jannaschia sp.]|uniref:extracellular catalytic domain type 1 short-chain-length polyhydroxyalkanoate depolymerase n=1 Tax=uncultured Jannaschia sp. TaxID=293347 RepID=UPI00263759F6|nr:PHB depolymerase family esterase [uncultured Jannaschia sp.]